MDSLNSVVVILIFSSLLLLSFLSFTNPLKVNKRANVWFGISFALWSSFWIEEILILINIVNVDQSLFLVIHFIQIFAPTLFYLSIVNFTNPEYKISVKTLKHLIIPGLYLILLLLYRYKFTENAFLGYFVMAVILFQSLFYSVLSIFKIRKHQKRILTFSSTTRDIDLSWLEYIIYLIFFTTLVVSFFNIFVRAETLDLSANFIILFVIYYIAYFLLRQKEIYPVDEHQRTELLHINEENPTVELRKKIISDDDLVKYKHNLGELMLRKEPFLDSELNLIKLAELINLTPHQVSFIINNGYNENFYQFINKYRVNKAKQLLKSDSKNNLTILAIAFESGFNSKTSFNTAFKKITSFTPSEFKKNSSDL